MIKRQQWKKEESPFRQEILQVKRPVRVTKRGRRFSFTALLLLKDEKKKAIAFGLANGSDARTAIQKAKRVAEKNLITYFAEPLRTIPKEIEVKFKATKIFFKPVPAGTGVKAGSVLNTFFKFLGIKDVSAKIITKSKNKLNIIRGAFQALENLTGKKSNY